MTRGGRPAGLVLAGFLFVLAAAPHPAAHDPITTKVTFAREIRAILAARCAGCHSPRGSAPMPLTTYDETRPWARAIKEMALTRRMPKWHAARGFGAFSNDPTLTPFELALIVSWVDGGLPRGAESTPIRPVASAFRRKMPRRDNDWLLSVRAGRTIASAHRTAEWITGWSFEPGDPLITSARIESSAGPLGTWVAGDGAVMLPAGTAMRVAGSVRVELHRRPPADFESAFTPRNSVLRVRVSAAAPSRRVFTEETTCGAAPTQSALLLAVRPLLEKGAGARVWMQRPGAPAVILGWFRDFAPEYPRTYWLARPLELSADALLQADAPCRLILTKVAGT